METEEIVSGGEEKTDILIVEKPVDAEKSAESLLVANAPIEKEITDTKEADIQDKIPETATEEANEANKAEGNASSCIPHLEIKEEIPTETKGESDIQQVQETLEPAKLPAVSSETPLTAEVNVTKDVPDAEKKLDEEEEEAKVVETKPQSPVDNLPPPKVENISVENDESALHSAENVLPPTPVAIIETTPAPVAENCPPLQPENDTASIESVRSSEDVKPSMEQCVEPVVTEPSTNEESQQETVGKAELTSENVQPHVE